MAKYCHSCRIKLGYFGLTLPITVTGTEFRYDKFIKHITVPSGGRLVSVEDDPSYNAYHNGIIDTTASGFVHVDSGGTTLVLYVGEKIGVTYGGASYYADNNPRKVVCPYKPGKIHSY